MVWWWFHLINEIPIDCLYTKCIWTHTHTHTHVYIYIGFWTLKLRCTQHLEFLEEKKVTSKNARATSCQSQPWQATFFNWVVGTCPLFYQETNKRGELVVSYKGSGWVWETSKKLPIMLQRIYRIYCTPISYRNLNPKDDIMSQHI